MRVELTIPGEPVAQPRAKATTCPRWTEAERMFLRMHYPSRGKDYCAKKLGRGEGAIRQMAMQLGLRIDTNSEWFRGWQRRAAKSKVGKKRPEQAEVMRRIHRDGKLIKTPEQRAAISVRAKAWIAKNGHPRGALGMKHTPDTLARIAAKSKANWDRLTDEQIGERNMKIRKTMERNGTTPIYNREKASWKAGWREIGGNRKYYRSRWEANYARYLEWLKQQKAIAGWSHEPTTFWFEGIKRGCVSYLPDFRVDENDGSETYHEVKGWMDDRSKTKIKRMAKYHPKVKLIVIDGKQYKALAKQVSAFVPGWE